ncbi:MAG: N-acetyltransferase [Methylobacteriaceae bacterium]|nr:N-acetyltransferase [Methylobacteriaceae bacterium]
MNGVSARPPCQASEREVRLSRHRYLIRPLLSADESGLVDMFSRSSPEDIRLRCLGTIKDFPHLAAKRLAGCDSTHEVALVAIDAEASGPGEIVGVVHLVDEPTEPGTAEFDIMVRTDMKGHGVGFQLMKDVLAQARRRGLKKIVGYVFYENRTMLLMASELGFGLEHVETGIVRVTAQL